MLQDLRFRIIGTDASAPAFQSVQGNVARTDKAVLALNSSVLTAGKSLVQAFSAGLLFGGVAALPTVLQQTAASAAKIGDVADKVGLTTDELQALRHAAEQTGVETNALDVAMQRFSRRTAQAAQGQGELVDILKANGLALRDSEGNMRPLLEVLKDYADLIKNAGSEQDALLLAFKAFDTEGAALVNTFREGGDGIEAFFADAHDLNVLLGEDMIRSAQDVDAKFKELSAVLTVNFKRGVLTAGDALAQFAGEIGNLDKLWRDFYNDPSFESFARFLFGDVVIPPNPLAPLLEGIEKLKSSGGTALLQDFNGFLTPTQKTILPVKPEQDKAAEAAEKQKEKVDALVASLRFEAEQLRRTSQEQEIYNALKQAGSDLTPQQEQDIRTAVEGLQAVRTEMELLEQQEKAVQQAQDFLFYAGSNALNALILYGEDAEDVMKRLALAIGEAALQALLLGKGPLGGLLGGVLPGLFSAKGNVFDGGNVVPFAKGGVLGAGLSGGGIVSRPTLFPMAHGMGLMGEAGPEAVMPLKRDSMGRLGVSAIPMGRGGGNGSDGVQSVHYSVAVKVDVSGARGDREIAALAETGADRALAKFRRDVLPGDVKRTVMVGRRQGDIR